MVAEDQEPVYPTARAAFFGSTIVSTDPLLAIAGDVHWASNSSHWDVALQVNDTLVFVPDPRTTFVSTMTLADWVTRAERHGQYQGWSHAYGTHQPVAHFHGSFDA